MILHSLAYEITQLVKTNHITFHGHCTHPLWWPTLLECASLSTWTNPPLTYCVSHWIFFNETSRTWASVSSVQSFSRVWLFVTTWAAAHQDSLTITNSCGLLKLMSIESVMPSNYLMLCHILLLLPPTLPSIRVFSNVSILHIRWPKHCSFSFIISTSNEYSGLISFRMDWFDLLAVQEMLKSFLQHHSSKA